jgi:hypothetical protein
MKKILIILFLIMINNISFADHKEFECTGMLVPWNRFLYHDSIFAPWNNYILDSMFAPWNSMFCNKKKTNDYMRKKGFNQRYFWK